MASPLIRRLARIAITMLIAFAVSAVAVFLGFWQYDRHLDRDDALAKHQAAEDLAPEPVGELVAPGLEELPEDVEWRMVTVTGTFMEGEPFILRTRPVEGTPAWQYLAWLNTDDGRSLMVNLGWVPQPGPNEDVNLPDLDPSHQVTVTGIMRVWEPDDGKPPGTTVSRISLEQLPDPAHEPFPGYMMLREREGVNEPIDQYIGTPAPMPHLTLGPHLAYAWQWWVFALLAPVGGVLLLRRDALMKAEAQAHASRTEASGDSQTAAKSPAAEPGAAQVPADAKPTRASARRRRSRELSDEEIEDAL